MRLLLLAAIMMLAGLSLLLVMVVRLAEPSLFWSLIAYAAICAGMITGLAGGVQREQKRR